MKKTILTLSVFIILISGCQKKMYEAVSYVQNAFIDENGIMQDYEAVVNEFYCNKSESADYHIQDDKDAYERYKKLMKEIDGYIDESESVLKEISESKGKLLPIQKVDEHKTYEPIITLYAWHLYVMKSYLFSLVDDMENAKEVFMKIKKLDMGYIQSKWKYDICVQHFKNMVILIAQNNSQNKN